MDRHMNEALYHFGFGKNNMNGISLDFKRIAITHEQIQEFDLPPTPEDNETLEKLDRDSRTDGFVDKYGELFAVELDALLAIVPEEFQEIVQDSVDQYFDADTYEQMRQKHTPEEIRRLVHQKLEELRG